MAKANIPSLATESVLNDKGLFKGAWARYMHELWQRVGGGDLYSLGGLLYSSTTTVGNITGGEDDLISYSLPRNTMHNDTDVLEIIAFGIYANNSHDKTLKFYFDGTLVYTTAIKTPQNTAWQITCRIMRITATTQKVIVSYSGEALGGAVNAFYTVTTVDLTVKNIIKCTGTSGSSATNDIVQEGLIVKLFPAF